MQVVPDQVAGKGNLALNSIKSIVNAGYVFAILTIAFFTFLCLCFPYHFRKTSFTMRFRNHLAVMYASVEMVLLLLLFTI